MTIFEYLPHRDEEALMALIQAQGSDWACYWEKEFNTKYRQSLRNSITRVVYIDHVLAGYVRALDDHGFYVYVCDLLVDPQYRGHHLGQRLMESLMTDYPGQTVYVMSDADPYYDQCGYEKVGSVFEAKRPTSGETYE